MLLPGASPDPPADAPPAAAPPAAPTASQRARQASGPLRASVPERSPGTAPGPRPAPPPLPPPPERPDPAPPGPPDPAERFCPDACTAAVYRRLAALGEAWASRRGSTWAALCNDGPPAPGAPPWPFRWRVLAEAVAFAAGRAPHPPRDLAALPLALQAFVARALPAALGGGTLAIDAARTAEALRQVEVLATELAAAPAQGDARSPSALRGQDASPAAPPVPAAAPPGPRARGSAWASPPASSPWPPVPPVPPAPPAPPASRDEDVADLLARALRAPLGAGAPAADVAAPGRAARDPAVDVGSPSSGDAWAADLPPAAAEVLRALRRGPVPLRQLRAIGAAYGVLPGSLLDAIDRAAVRRRGVPATSVEGSVVRLSDAYLAAGGGAPAVAGTDAPDLDAAATPDGGPPAVADP